MAQFSGAIHANLKAFASNMKLECEPSIDGSVSYLLSESGLLTFTPIKDGSLIVVSLGKEYRNLEPGNAEALLKAARLRPDLGVTLHAGRSKDGVDHLAITLEESEISTATLERTVDVLISEMENVQV